MRNIFFLFFFITSTLVNKGFASENLDSISFEQQRKHVNSLLDQRSQKFGEYDLSLEQKTGIFGLFKTKDDMQKSIDILKSIVINDNDIFIETRKLLDIKDNEREKFQKLANEYDAQVTAYMKTISKLQLENENLRNKIADLEDLDHSNNGIVYILILVIAALSFAIYRLFSKLNAKNVTKV